VAGLAVPASTVQRVVDFILQKGSVPTAYLGIGLHPVPIPETLQQKLAVKSREGLMILAVDEGGPAETAGILIGDIVVGVEGGTTDHLEAVHANLGPDRIGKNLHIQLIRGGELKNAIVVPKERRSAQ
jgi:serine protease Do